MILCPQTKKRPYNSKRLATKALKAFNANNPIKPLTMSYRCEHCNDWHNTSMDIHKGNAIRNRINHRDKEVIANKSIPTYIDGRIEYLMKKNKMRR